MGKDIISKIKRYLTLKKIQDYKTIEGWLSPCEALGLYTIAKKLKNNSTVVEIGSWQGKSTFCIARGLKSGKIYAIDPFNAGTGEADALNMKLYEEQMGDKDLLDNFTVNMKTFGVYNKIIIKKGYSSDFHDDFDKIDFLFIDGDHSIEGCKRDYDLYAHKIVKGGFIALHDYYDDRLELGPTYVIHNVIKKDEFQFYSRFDSLWVGIKN